MNYTQLIISTGLIAIDLASIGPRHNPECARHPPDTFQTPYRHPNIWHVLTNPRQLGEKENGNKDESNWIVINCLHIISAQAVSRVTQATPRHLPDTFQAPFRHPKYGTFLTNPRQLGDKKPANID